MKQFNLEEYLANPSRKVVTRKGLSVRILATDLEGSDFPIAAAIGNRYPLAYTSRGTRNYELRHEDDNDLFFVPEKKEGWINIFKGIFNDNRLLGHIRIFETKENAEEAGEGVSGYITTIKIEWEEE